MSRRSVSLLWGPAVGLLAVGVILMLSGASVRASDVTGELVFAQSRTPGLFAIASNGTGMRRLTAARDEDPALSPDGSRLAFVRNHRGAFELYVADAAGGHPRRITGAGGFAQTPTWAPDGSRIVFSASGGRWGTSADPSCAPNLWRVRPDGSRLRRLLRRGVQPAFSPDGSRLAFVRPDSNEREWLYIATAAGRRPKRIGRGAHPSWSPDGRRLVVERWAGDNRMSDLWSVRPSDGHATRLTYTMRLSELDPAWSPAGGTIAFSMFRRDRQDIYAMPAKGGEAVAVTHSSRDNGLQQPAWRPL